MSLWSSFRRFSNFRKNRDSEASRTSLQGRSRTRSLKHRDLRMEHFEQRVLLTITPGQTYLDNAFLDVQDAWSTATGAGVVVAVIDDGIDSTHPELSGAYRADLSWDFMNAQTVAGPLLAADNHGTAIAGMIAAANDGSGTAGVAYDAELASYRLTSLDPSTPLDSATIAAALRRGVDEIDVYSVNLNNSIELYHPGDAAIGAMRRGVAEGRNGLGAIYVYGAGNNGGDSNYDALVNSRYSIAVGSVYDSNGDGAVDTVISAPGTAVLVSGFAGPNDILTTDRMGADGYAAGDYTNVIDQGFGGVQAAAAQISGVVAMMLEANPALTYRDVQQILVQTSSNWAGGSGSYYDNGLGWGTVNAQAAVEAAAGWNDYVAPEAVARSGVVKNFSLVLDPDGVGSTNDSYVESTVDIASDIGSIEWVEVTLYGVPTDWAGNEILLTSPSGQVSRLTRPHATSSAGAELDNGWTFTSAAHWGDASGGEWKLTLANASTGQIGTWGAWDLKVFGQENAGGDTGPELVKIIPNQGGEVVDGDVLSVAPRELILEFNSHQRIDPATLGAIQIVRSGGDGTFGDGNEQTIVPGYIARGEQDNEVIIRFAETLPDDQYRLIIRGDEGNSPLRNIDGVPFNGGSDSTIRFDLDLGAQVVSVVPQPVYRGPIQVTTTALNAASDGRTFTVSDGFHEVTFEFNRDTDLLPGNIDNVASGNVPIRFAAGGVNSSQVANLVRTAIAAQITAGDLDGDLIGVAGVGSVVELSGRWASIALGAQLAFGVQTLKTLQQATDKVDVYFNDDDLDPASATNPAYYRLYNSVGTLYAPVEVFYDPIQDKAQLRFSGALPAETYHLEIGASSDPAATQSISPADNTNSSFDVPGHTATNLGLLGSIGLTITGGDIHRATTPLTQNGGNDEPGHRQIPIGAETHLNSGGPSAFQVVEYNFRDNYGWSTPNQIEENQKQRAREVFEIYAYYLGLEFRETASSGLTVITGDLRAIDSTVPTGPGGVSGISDGSLGGKVIMDASEEWGESEYGGSWFQTAMHEIGHSLGLLHAYEMSAVNIMGDWGTGEPVFPGTADLIHAQYIWPAASNEVNLYKFNVQSEGWFTAETIAERLASPSALDTKLILYREYDVLGTPVREVIAGNDDYYSDDSFMGLRLEPGTYYVGVMSTGMSDVDPTMENSGFGGTSEGNYELKISFVPTPSTTLVDATNTALDGDADGVAGGTYDFWFRVGDHTLFVDKANGGLGASINPGTSSLYTEIDSAIAGAVADDVIRVIGNDQDTPYLVGYSNIGATLADGALVQLPAQVTMMVDAGAIFKLQKANLDIGSSAQGINRTESALQVLGTPFAQVHFRSFRDDSIGGDTDGASTGRAGGDWGGLVFRADSDREANGVFLNTVSFADIQHGGGEVTVDSIKDNYTAIHTIAARPTIAYNEIRNNAGGGISADLTSFEEAGGRIGPDIHGNRLLQNTMDGLFVRIETEFGDVVESLEVPARWDDTDIVHIVTENLLIQGTPGGELNGVARIDARLRVDPAVVVKLEGARIHAEIAGQLIAEGLPGYPVVFTSLRDDTYGMGGGFDTTNDGNSNPAYPGQWGGLIFAPTSKGSLDYVYLAYAGGETALGGDFESFNAIEIHQADVRIANSYITRNAEGGSADSRNGLGSTRPATIFARGAQPVILNNTITDNNNIAFPNTEAIDDVGDVISIDVNSLNTKRVPDPGRSTGYAEIFTQVADNLGPLVRYNRLDKNDVNSFAIRGGVLTTESVWDDTDIVHVMREEIEILNKHTFGGLRLQSSPTESLVVKLSGTDTGFTADGTPLDIDDRIGGTLQILGQPNNPVVLSSLNDLTIGAGFTPDGQSMKDTLNVGITLDPGAGSTPYVDVIVVMDESGSMGYVQQFTEQMIPQLDAALIAAGIGDGTLGVNQFGLVGFGGSSFANPPGTPTHEAAHTHLLNGNLWGSSTEYVTAAQTLVTSGAREDGWDGIQYALDNYSLRPDAAKFIILATDEPRSLVNPNVTYNSVLANLQSEGVILEGILGTYIRDANNQMALALDADGTAYIEDGNGGFTSSAGGSFWYGGSTITDYANMVFATDGLVGDISQIGQGGNTSTSFATAMISQILVQAGAGNPAGAGDWRSVSINEYANTRNVAVATEVEPSYLVDGGTNDIPYSAESLGFLAPDSATDDDDDEKGGDENQRLGFEVHGHISMNDPGDVDVYSFTAKAGTEVWIDVDRTSFGLDAMVELIQADGTWLARSTSNTSFIGNTDPSIINPVVPTSLITDAWLGRDYYTTNELDPAMHLVLPGIEGTAQTYFVRMASENGTSGQYQMQLRLRQVDETPGSTVRYADIRYATRGIEVHGQPAHSLLSGEATETATNNNAWSTSSTQDLGNLLTSDRNTVSVAGNLSAENDVDWYKFSLDYDLIQAIGGFSDGFKTWSTIFDLDYADGLSRADAVISVYDSTGNLILVSRDSNVEDDQPGAGTGNDLDDLSRGSAGTLDPFIGSVQMPAGVKSLGLHREYYVAVTSNLQLPSVLQAPFEGNNANSSALYRLEPVNSVQRIAEDHIGLQGHRTGRFGYNNNIVSPEASLFPNVNLASSLETNVVPYTLSDVVLFVSTNEARLRTVNPFTGATVTDIGGLNGTNGVGDIAMRGDGTLMAQLANNNPNDGNTGELRVVNTGSAGLSGGGSDGLTTDPDGASPYYQDFAAMAFRDTGNGTWQLYAVNNNTYDMDTNPADVNDGRPAVWRINSDTGAVIDENTASTAPGAQPAGYLTGITAGERVTGLAISGSTMYAVTSGAGGGHLYRAGITSNGTTGSWTSIPLDAAIGTPNFSGLTFGPRNLDVHNNRDVAAPYGVPDEDPNQTAELAGILFASTSSGALYAFTTGGTAFSAFDSDADGLADTYTRNVGYNITGLAFSTLDFNLWHPTMSRRNDDGHGINEAFDLSRSNTTWQTTLNGRDASWNEGGASFYFGMEPWVNDPDGGGQSAYFDDYTFGGSSQNAQLGLTEAAHRDISANSATQFTYDMPGGASGKLVTNSFSLAGSTYEDKPTLYFNYFLETQGASGGGTGAANMRDSARVFISTDGGQLWQLLATNNSTKSNNVDRHNELPWYLTASARPSLDITTHERQQVQELYDNTGVWRQARVDLGEYAGQMNLMLRFDFSTAGKMAVLDTVAPVYGDTDVDNFGDLGSAQRGQNNSFEGFYVDDIIIGYAERGEMVTQDDSVNTSPTSFYTVPQNPATGAPEEILVGDYQLEIRRGTEYGQPVSKLVGNIWIVDQYHSNTRMTPQFYRLGDENLPREQDQLILQGNTIRDSVDYGIYVDAGARDLGLVQPASHPGGVIKSPVTNTEALVPGVVIMNNVVAHSGVGGIYFSGDAGSPAAPVPFGRIVNNTIAGSEAAPSQYGIHVTENASPTILNNIITSANTAILISNSPGTVVSHNLFKDYGTIGTQGSHPIDIDLLLANNPNLDDLPLFVDPLNYNYYLASGALAIDSSVDVLGERNGFLAVKSSLVIPPSPIIAPEWDRYGQLRRDDPAQSPPSGMGASIFKDRGAIERADFVGPTAVLADPLDNQQPRVETKPKEDGQFDYDDTVTDVVVINRKTTDFAVQLLALEGIGIDDTSVNPATVITLYRTTNMNAFNDPATFPQPLMINEDYVVRFDEINDVLHVIPTSGVWETGAYYVIRVNNSASAGVRDQAGNALQPTRSGGPFDGQTIFTLHLTGLDFGDLPDDPADSADYPTLLESGIQGGARHVVTAGMYLGSPPDVELQGHADDNARGDSYDDGVTVTSALVLGKSAQFTIYASAAGYLNAWIDLNGDGDAAVGAGEGNERIARDLLLQPGYNTLTVPINSSDVAMAPGEYVVERFGRFRFTSMKFEDVAWLYQAGSSFGGFEGLAYDGEVEDYQFEILRFEQDWGDAPSDPLAGSPLYPVLSAQNGAAHYIDPSGPHLGTQVDAEVDGQPTGVATGDDNNGDDEDGIVFVDHNLVPGNPIPGNNHSQVGVMLNGVTNALVEAWIDFNGDGVWADEWATTGTIDPNGEHDAFVITADQPGQIGTGIRVQFHVASALSVGYVAADRILHINFVPDTTTTKDVVDAINNPVNDASDYLTAEFVAASPNSGSGRIGATDLPSGSTFTTAGGSFAVPATIGAINPNGANNAFEVSATVADPIYNGLQVTFNHVLNPGDRARAVWNAGTKTLTVTFEPGVTRVSDIVAKINLAGAPLVATLAADPNLGAGVFTMSDTVVKDGAEFVLDGAYERILTNMVVDQSTVAEPYQYKSFIVPADAVPGQTFARFRVTSSGHGADGLLLGVDGQALDGEVEDYALTIDRVDYGDAPQAFNTLLTIETDGTVSSDGARHVIAGPWFGSAVDHDPVGLPGSTAVGDDSELDIDRGDDEDGVVFLVPGATPQIVPGGPVNIQVTLNRNDFDGRAFVSIDPAVALQNDAFIVRAANYGDLFDGATVSFERLDGLPNSRLGTIPQTSIADGEEFSTSGGSGGTLAMTDLIDPDGANNAFRFVATSTGTAAAGITVRFRHATIPGAPVSVVWIDAGAPVDPKTLIVTIEPGVHTLQNLIDAVANLAVGSPLVIVAMDDTNAPPVASYDTALRNLNVVYNDGATSAQMVDAINQTALFVAELDTSNPNSDGSDDVSVALLDYTDTLAGGQWPGLLDAWFDVDGDNVFEESADERIFSASALSLGVNSLQFNVPVDAVVGNRYLRFRVTSDGLDVAGVPLGPDGLALSGEVEDYMVIVQRFDFGDAPDTYATLLNSNGARHVITGPWLGEEIDHDENGIPGPNADGDDDEPSPDPFVSTMGADEDGITLATQVGNHLIPGESATFTITIGGAVPADVHGWLDWNRNGVFDVGEDAFHLSNVLGEQVTSVLVPLSAVPGPTIGRFRIVAHADNWTPSSLGLAPSGEVEDYLYTIANVDYGDAPNTHSTSYASSGARHVIDPTGPYLGTSVDHDNDGAPSPGAVGDDTYDGQDDEDGATFSSLLLINNPANEKGWVDIVAPTGGVVDVWIDFNGNGVWDNLTAEHVIASEPVTTSPQRFEFDVPDMGYSGAAYARVRITSDGKDAAGNPLTPTGLAADGEVEDYPVFVDAAPIAEAGGPYWINTNESLTLNGSGSTDVDMPPDSIVRYEWDVDYDPILNPVWDPEWVTTNAISTVPWPWPFINSVPQPRPKDGLSIYLRVVDNFGAMTPLSLADTTKLFVFDNEVHAKFVVTDQSGGTPGAYSPVDVIRLDNQSWHDRGADLGFDKYLVKYEWDFDYSGTFSPDEIQTAVRPDGSIDTALALSAGFGDTTHAYGKFGTYTAVLRVTDSNNPAKTAMYSQIISVTAGNFVPLADAGGPYTINIGDAAAMTGSGSLYDDPAFGSNPASWGDSIVKWQWDLNNDGVYDVQGNQIAVSWAQLTALVPQVAIPAANEGYAWTDVTLRVEDSLGKWDTVKTQLYVHENQPHAEATASSLAIVPGAAVAFDGTNSWHDRNRDQIGDHLLTGDPNSGRTWGDAVNRSIVTYEWDLHYDGSFNPEAATATLNYSGYTQFGTYQAMLRVTDNNSPARRDFLDQAFTIVVNQGDEAPVADPGGPYKVAVGNGVVLDASASTDANLGAGDAITTYKWTLLRPGQPGLEILTTSPTYAMTAAYLNSLGLTLGESYELKLQVQDKEIPDVVTADWSDVATTTLSIHDNEVFAVVTSDDMTVAPGDVVAFDASGSYNPHPDHDIVTYEWDFDYDGVTFVPDPAAGTTSATATRAFGQFGTYRVAVRATDDAGKSDIAEVTIDVSEGNEAPTAEAGGPSLYLGEAAYFLDVNQSLTLDASASSDPDVAFGDSIVSYQWDLDNDGQFDDAVGVHPTLSWTNLQALGVTGLGPHTIGLQVTDEFGVADTDSSQFVIFTNQPTAVINIDDADGQVGPTTKVDFYGIDSAFGTGSTAGRPDRQIVKYEWDFNSDGFYEVVQSDPLAAGFGVVNDVTFPMFQLYTVSLRVTDNNSPVRTDTDSITISVNQGNLAPHAAVSVPAIIEMGEGITLDGSASFDPDAAFGDAIVSYAWTVDGKQLLIDEPTATLTADDLAGLALSDPDEVVVTLTVTDKFGNQDTDDATFAISDNQPNAVFTALPNPVACNTEVEFDASESENPHPNFDIVHYEWDFNYDGTFDVDAEGEETTHSFSQFGEYEVALRVTDNNVPAKTDIFTVVVSVSLGNRAPVADAGGPYVFTTGQAIVVDASQSTDPDQDCGDSIAAYRWDLDNDGDFETTGVTVTIPASSLIPDQPRTIRLQVEDSQGGLLGVDTTTVTLTTNAAPVADAGGPYTGSEGTSLVLNGTGSSDDVAVVGYEWDLDYNGTTFVADVTGAQPSVTFDDDIASRTIALRVTDAKGLSHIDTTTITIGNADPVAGDVTVDPSLTIDEQAIIEGGQSVTVSGSFTDLGVLDTHTVVVDWNDGTTSNATVDQEAGTFEATHTFAGVGQYTITATVADDDDGSAQATAIVNVADNLGTVDFRDDLTDLDPSDGDLWLLLTAAHDAFLTVELGGAGATAATVLLYDADGNVVSAMANGPSDGADYLVDADDSYYLKLSGTAADVDLRLTNLVSVDGSAVTVLGTDQDDAFEFELTAGRIVRINGTRYQFADVAGVAETVNFDGGDGTDSATFTGSEAIESARFFTGVGEFFSGSETYDGTGYFVEVAAENLIAFSGGGRDFAKMYDSPGDDLFTSSPATSTLVGVGFSHAAHNFYSAHGYATNRTGDDRSGGNDHAIMHDSEGKDKLKVDWADAEQFFGKLYAGNYYTRAKNFEIIDAASTGGDDLAVVIASPGNDELYLKQGVGRITSELTEVEFLGFNTVIASAGAGYDIVRLEDTLGDDEMRGRSHKTTMIGPGYSITARYFDEVYAEAKNGGDDKAKFHPTAAGDILHAREVDGKAWAQLAVDGVTEDLLYEALGFDLVRAYDSDGNDTVDRTEEFNWLLLDGDWTDL